MEHETPSLTQPNVYIEQINKLKQQVPLIVTDFNKYFVLTKKNPDYEPYSTFFNQVKNKMKAENATILQINKNLNKNIDQLNKNLHTYHTKIEKEKVKQALMRKQEGNADYLGSSERIQDYDSMYDTQYAKNILLICGILMLGNLIYKQRNV